MRRVKINLQDNIKTNSSPPRESVLTLSFFAKIGDRGSMMKNSLLIIKALLLSLVLGSSVSHANFFDDDCEGYTKDIKKQQKYQMKKTLEIEVLNLELDIYKNELEALKIKIVTKSFEKNPQSIITNINHFQTRLELYSERKYALEEASEERLEILNTKGKIEQKFEDECSL